MESHTADHYSPPLSTDQIVRVRILSRLQQIDSESTRPLRAVLVGKATDADHEKLQQLDTEAHSLRSELCNLLATL